MIIIPCSGYIPSEFNFVLFVLIPCGTNIFQTKRALIFLIPRVQNGCSERK